MGPCSAKGQKKTTLNKDTAAESTTNSKPSNVSVTSFENVRKIYHYEKVLGHGAFAVVRLVSLKTDSSAKFAMKMIEKEKLKEKLYLLRRELEILSSLDHPNIIKFHETYQDDKYLYILMEYCSGGELLEKLVEKKHFSEKDAAKVIYTLLSALNYLHVKRVCHRDLKLENLLYKDKSEDSPLKMIDFGLSVHMNDDCTQLHSKVGTPLYVAPEVIKGNYTEACDMWSLGVIFFILLSGSPPFFDKDENKLFSRITDTSVDFKDKAWSKISFNAIDLIAKMLNKDPSVRITAEQALRHPWFNNLDKRFSREITDNFEADEINIIQRLRDFQTPTKLKKEVLKVFLNSLTEKEIEDMRETFQIMDKHKTGTINFDELFEVLKTMGYDDPKEEIERILHTINLEHQDCKEINYTDFLTATLDSKLYLNKQKLWRLFKYFDPMNSNFITVEDLKLVFLREGKNLSNEEIQEIIQESNHNDSGKISFEEFCKMMEPKRPHLEEKDRHH